MTNISTQQPKERKVSAFKVKLIGNLSVGPEGRNEPIKGVYPGGRFKRYLDILKTYFQPLMILNLFTMIFALPLVGLFLFFEIYGFEQFGYLISGISANNPPFLLNHFGIGVSLGLGINVAKSTMLLGYRVLVAGVALFLPLAGVGIAGNLYVCSKMIWGESLLMKKDKYGNDVPRIAKEFLKGVKLFSARIVASITVFGLIFAATAFITIEFIDAIWLGRINAGHYVGLIASISVSVYAAMVMTTYLPFVVSYRNMKIKEIFKNSLIIATGFSVSAILVFVFSFFPFALIFAKDMVKLIVTIVILSFGLSHSCLVLTNFADYNSENLIQPLYQQELKTQIRAERKKTKKTDVAIKQNYKKKNTPKSSK